MVNLLKMLRLGGFKSSDLYFGFAEKVMGPDTPHDETRTKWMIDKNGRKVEAVPEDMETKSSRYEELIERDLVENPDVMNSEAIIDRLSWANVVCYYAEQGVSNATQFALKLLHQEPSFKIRRLIVKRLMFAARQPVTPEKKAIMEATISAISDDHADVRGLVIEMCDKKCIEQDRLDVDMYLAVSNRNTALRLRGHCASSDKFEDLSASGLVGSGAWLTLQEMAIAFKDDTFLRGLVAMLSHQVFSVRICAWLFLSDSSFASEIERCKTLEIKITQLRRRNSKLRSKRSQVEARHENAIREFMENSRDRIASERLKLQGRLNDDLLAQKTQEIIEKIRSFGMKNDEMIISIGRELQRAKKKEKSTSNDLSMYLESYQQCVSSLKEMIISKVGTMLSYNSSYYLSLNSFFENKGRENWYIRKSALEFLGEIAKAGYDSAKEFLSSSENDRSPYVRRAYRNVVQEVLALKIHSNQSQSQVISPEKESNAADICATPEDQRKFNKALRLRRERMGEEQLIRSVNVLEFSCREVCKFLEELRPRFLEQTDRYIRQAKRNEVDGEQLIDMSEKDMREVLGITMRKHRAILKLKIKEKIDYLKFYTDPQQMETANKELLQESAKKYFRIMKVDRNSESKDEVVKTLSFDVPQMHSDEARCSAILVKRADGQFVFTQVSCVSSGVKEGDILLKIQDTNIHGLTWDKVADLFLAHGQICMCTILISSESADPRGSSGPPDNSGDEHARIRTLQVISHCDSRHHCREQVQGLGLNVELMSFDDFQLLQLINWFSRHKFSKYLARVLSESSMNDLRHLAMRHNDSQWLQSLEMDSQDLTAFQEAMVQLATKFGIIKEEKLLEGERRLDFGFDWVLLHGSTAPYVSRHSSRFRSQDASESLSQFKTTGRDAVVVERSLEGLEYSLLWHRSMNVGVELMHTSTGMFRLHVPSSSKTAPTAANPVKVFLVYSDGSVEPTRSLNAIQLWGEIWKQEPVEYTEEEHAVEEEEQGKNPSDEESESASEVSVHQDNILGLNFGSSTPRSPGNKSQGQEKRHESSEMDSEVDSDGEDDVVGYHVFPSVGMRVGLRSVIASKYPHLLEETGGSLGRISWVDPTDLDGDGVTGDICEVTWDNGYMGDYRTGFEGHFRLREVREERHAQERVRVKTVIGRDVDPHRGQRVTVSASSARDEPAVKSGTIVDVKELGDPSKKSKLLRASCKVLFDNGEERDIVIGGDLEMCPEDRGQESFEAAARPLHLRTIDEDRERESEEPWDVLQPPADDVQSHKSQTHTMDLGALQPMVSYHFPSHAQQTNLVMGHWEGRACFRLHPHLVVQHCRGKGNLMERRAAVRTSMMLTQRGIYLFAFEVKQGGEKVIQKALQFNASGMSELNEERARRLTSENEEEVARELQRIDLEQAQTSAATSPHR
uniref:SAM domain-containing protein n=2 Tax=Guillardia theta TaxID=55529 RepID=A0A6U6BCY5_GUITH|mmetsp:Transcript_35712/g.111709  ORF Transcript_35712/g.111709 Transcript_35712/m.111709 type:complete len:1417 (+) Transcript_35712:141-4391(+)